MLLNNDQCYKCQDNNCRTCYPIMISRICTNGYFLENDRCSPNCPVGTFKNTNTQTCDYCKSHCRYCYDNITCRGCDINFFLYNNECLGKCPGGYYPKDGNCYACEDSKCEKCYENAPDKCRKCKPPMKLLNYNCVFNCTNGYYDNGNGECKDCGWNCQNCNDNKNCTTCNPPFVVNNEGTCGDKCPEGSVEKDRKCMVCPTTVPYCSKCNVNNTAICDRCNNLKVLDVSYNICVPSCRDNYYSDGTICRGKN